MELFDDEEEKKEEEKEEEKKEEEDKNGAGLGFFDIDTKDTKSKTAAVPLLSADNALKKLKNGDSIKTTELMKILREKSSTIESWVKENNVLLVCTKEKAIACPNNPKYDCNNLYKLYSEEEIDEDNRENEERKIFDNLPIDSGSKLGVEVFVHGTGEYSKNIKDRLNDLTMDGKAHFHNNVSKQHKFNNNTLYFFPTNITDHKFDLYSTAKRGEERANKQAPAVISIIEKILGKKRISQENVHVCFEGYSYGNYPCVRLLYELFRQADWLLEIDNLFINNVGPDTFFLPKAQKHRQIVDTLKAIKNIDRKIANIEVNHKVNNDSDVTGIFSKIKKIFSDSKTKILHTKKNSDNIYNLIKNETNFAVSRQEESSVMYTEEEPERITKKGEVNKNPKTKKGILEAEDEDREITIIIGNENIKFKLEKGCTLESDDWMYNKSYKTIYCTKKKGSSEEEEEESVVFTCTNEHGEKDTFKYFIDSKDGKIYRYRCCQMETKNLANTFKDKYNEEKNKFEILRAAIFNKKKGVNPSKCMAPDLFGARTNYSNDVDFRNFLTNECGINEDNLSQLYYKDKIELKKGNFVDDVVEKALKARNKKIYGDNDDDSEKEDEDEEEEEEEEEVNVRADNCLKIGKDEIIFFQKSGQLTDETAVILEDDFPDQKVRDENELEKTTMCTNNWNSMTYNKFPDGTANIMINFTRRESDDTKKADNETIVIKNNCNFNVDDFIDDSETDLYKKCYTEKMKEKNEKIDDEPFFPSNKILSKDEDSVLTNIIKKNFTRDVIQHTIMAKKTYFTLGRVANEEENVIIKGLLSREFNGLINGTIYKFKNSTRQKFDEYKEASTTNNPNEKRFPPVKTGNLTLGYDGVVKIFGKDLKLKAKDTVECKSWYDYRIVKNTPQKVILTHGGEKYEIEKNAENDISVKCLNDSDEEEEEETVKTIDDLVAKINGGPAKIEEKKEEEEEEKKEEEKEEEEGEKKEEEKEEEGEKKEEEEEIIKPPMFDPSASSLKIPGPSDIIEENPSDAEVENEKDSSQPFKSEVKKNNAIKNRQQLYVKKKEETQQINPIKATNNKQQNKTNKNIDANKDNNGKNDNDNTFDLFSSKDTTEKPELNIMYLLLLAIFTLLIGAAIYYYNYKQKEKKYNNQKKINNNNAKNTLTQQNRLNI